MTHSIIQSPTQIDIEKLNDIAKRIVRQADCLDHYAEQSGFKAGPLPSVFHLQSSHFRDLAKEIAPLLSTLEYQAARVAELEGVLRPFAERRTISEILANPEQPEWLNATPERRIEMMGERKRANDAAILAARNALSPTTLCEDCPPIGYPTDKTRCTPCPHRSTTTEER